MHRIYSSIRIITEIVEEVKQKYTLATKAADLESVVVSGAFSVLMIVWACLTEDKRFLFIPLICLTVAFICFVALLFRFITEPKIAIQADVNGIYFYFRNNKVIFIDFKDIVEVAAQMSYHSFGYISISTQSKKYTSIMIRERKHLLVSNIKDLLNKEDKEQYLLKIAITKK